MLIELNGLSFHLEILRDTGPSWLRARIVDEAFQLPPMERPVSGADCVFVLVADYCGIAPDKTLREQIAWRVAELAPVQPARVFADVPGHGLSLSDGARPEFRISALNRASGVM